ncbi:MAG: alpha/beta hydrolase [Adhaeribacter sp.]
MKFFLASLLSCLGISVALAGESLPAGQGSANLTPQPKPAIALVRNIRYAPQPADFAADTSSDRLLDVYRPAGVSGTLPVILFIHGGGFSGGDKNGTAAVCNSLSAMGYAVVSINYRLELKRKKVSGASASANMAKGLPEKGEFHPALQQAVSTASEDAQLALNWIKENAAAYRFNKAAVAISGGSAGGMTALHTAYVSKQKVLPIGAVVNLWGGLENADLIKKGAPPVLTFHGDQDKLIHVDFAHAISKRMGKIGNTQSELQVMQGLGHARYDVIAKEKADEIDAFLRKVFK